MGIFIGSVSVGLLSAQTEDTSVIVERPTLLGDKLSQRIQEFVASSTTPVLEETIISQEVLAEIRNEKILQRLDKILYELQK